MEIKNENYKKKEDRKRKKCGKCKNINIYILKG
jgi:hypothetical protein